MTLRTIVLIPALGLPILSSIVLGIYGGGWYYCGLIISMFVLFIIAEVLSIKKRSKTISQDIAEAPKWVFWFVTGSFLILGVGMSIHWILFL